MSAEKPRTVEEWDPLYGQIKDMYVWRDMLCLPCMPKDLMEEMIDNFKFKEDDVLLASYPQSSFFWAQEVLWHLHNLDTLDVAVEQKPALAHRVPFLEHEFKNADPKKILKEYASPRLVKTHLAHRYWRANLKDVEDKVKVILWTAEPKDVVVNYCDYWNIKGVYFNFPKVQWDYFFELFKKERLFEGDWHEMNVEWIKNYENKSNFLLLTYEEARRNPKATVRKMAQFLGIIVTDSQVDKITNIKEFDKWPEWSRLMSQEQKEFVDKKTRDRVAGTELAKHYPTDSPN